jgi:hypothetical protein
MKANKPFPAREHPPLVIRRPYEKPDIKRVDLALTETLSISCKMDSDTTCVGPPFRIFMGGS